jgi:cell division protein FtsN
LLIKPASNGAFQVHLSTFASRLSAVEYSRDIAFKGKEIEIAPRQVSARETWYRVLVGPYANWDEASRAISEMQKGGILKSYPISPSKMPIH